MRKRPEIGTFERDPVSSRDPGLMVVRSAWIADLFLGRLGPALDRLRKSVEMNPNVAVVHFFLTAAAGLSGRTDEASAAREAGLRLDPNFTVARFRNEQRSQNRIFLGQRERIYEDGLRLAGWRPGREIGRLTVGRDQCRIWIESRSRGKVRF